MLSPGRKGQEGRGYLGGEVLLFPVLPRQASCPGDHLHLAVNCSAIVFSCLSQFSQSTCQGIFLLSYYPLSQREITAFTEPTLCVDKDSLRVT